MVVVDPLVHDEPEDERGHVDREAEAADVGDGRLGESHRAVDNAEEEAHHVPHEAAAERLRERGGVGIERRWPELGRDLGLHGRFARYLKTLRQGHRRRICAAVTQLAELTHAKFMNLEKD